MVERWKSRAQSQRSKVREMTGRALRLAEDKHILLDELHALKARRCDGCDNSEHLTTCEYHCGLLNIYVVSDFACNAWVPKKNGEES